MSWIRMVKAFCSVAWLIHHCVFTHFFMFMHVWPFLSFTVAVVNGWSQATTDSASSQAAGYSCLQRYSEATVTSLLQTGVPLLKHSTQRFLNELSDDVYHINTISQNLLHGAPETDLKPSEPSFVHIITVNEKAPSWTIENNRSVTT